MSEPLRIPPVMDVGALRIRPIVVVYHWHGKEFQEAAIAHMEVLSVDPGRCEIITEEAA